MASLLWFVRLDIEVAITTARESDEDQKRRSEPQRLRALPQLRAGNETKEVLRSRSVGVRTQGVRGMRVVFDAVFHHTGRDFREFREVREKGKGSRYCDWYYLDFNPSESVWRAVSLQGMNIAAAGIRLRLLVSVPVSGPFATEAHRPLHWEWTWAARRKSNRRVDYEFQRGVVVRLKTRILESERL